MLIWHTSHVAVVITLKQFVVPVLQNVCTTASKLRGEAADLEQGSTF
jgi:hypothetical protein